MAAERRGPVGLDCAHDTPFDLPRCPAWQNLDEANVGAAFEQMRGETVPQDVHAHPLSTQRSWPSGSRTQTRGGQRQFFGVGALIRPQR